MIRIGPVFFVLILGVFSADGQIVPTGSPLPAKSTAVTVTRERREQALASLLEGQRYAWASQRTRSQAAISNNTRLSRAAYQRAVELDPSLAEAYTALAELAIITPPNDIDSAIELASRAVAIDRNNFGAQRIIARLSTFKSRINFGVLDKKSADIAIAAWKEVTRIDPRFAEGWAFQAAFYDQLKMPTERIEALRKWLASAQPLEIGFYRQVMGAAESLAPEAASIKLGSALVDAGQMAEAVEVLSRVVADEPDSPLAILLLKQAVESSETSVSSTAIQSLQQAVYTNPENVTLYELIAQMQASSGRIDDAAAGLKRSALALWLTNRAGSASLQVALGDIYTKADRVAEAVEAFEKALETREIGRSAMISSEDREFAILVFGKLIQAYKTAKRTADVNATISRARKLLGQQDLFSS
ncbi:MAG: tetratricopeptide repeat protein [Pyrinomonadaceae bacterium]